MTNQGTGIMFYSDFGRKVKRLQSPKEEILDKPKKTKKKVKGAMKNKGRYLKDDREYIATASN
jgi:hypothetical protein